MSEPTSADVPGEDIVDAEIVEDGAVEVWHPRTEVEEYEPRIEAWATDLDRPAPAPAARPHRQTTEGAAAGGGGSRGGRGPGGGGGGGRSGGRSKKRRRGSGSRGGGFTLFGFHFHFSPHLDLLSGNSLIKTKGRPSRGRSSRAQSSWLLAGTSGRTRRRTRRRIHQAGWLDRALGGGR